jgi:hypothetical protein
VNWFLRPFKSLASTVPSFLLPKLGGWGRAQSPRKHPMRKPTQIDPLKLIRPARMSFGSRPVSPTAGTRKFYHQAENNASRSLREAPRHVLLIHPTESLAGASGAGHFARAGLLVYFGQTGPVPVHFARAAPALGQFLGPLLGHFGRAGPLHAHFAHAGSAFARAGLVSVHLSLQPNLVFVGC